MKHMFENHCPRCKTVMILMHPRDHAAPVWICPVCGKSIIVAPPNDTEAPATENTAERPS